ncbi:MAG TPA: 3-dehydroquinate synthase family protein, partial [candidate division Zixibacteria bacterium]|nr:3-dehydroquinate synthase family protein [candidate division Zixibacteria bacterium]
TLLGMVDAAIGGKTGINHSKGKNLIGAFWQPSFVTCDLNYLNTLPNREIIAGLGEILKYSGLIGSKMIRPFKSIMDSSDFPRSNSITPLIKLSAQYKAQIVMADERESHKRMLLNFGHTFGHAIEKTLGYGKLLHGEAVIIGLLAAVRLSKHKNPQAAGLTEYEILVKQLLAFVRYYPLKEQSILNNMKLDKKRFSGVQKFVLLRRPGKPFISAELKEQLIRKSISECLSIYREIGGKNV